MAQIHEGRCSCGAVRYRALNAPVRTSVCHCTFCQRRTGSAFGISAFFRDEDVEFRRGELKNYEHRSAETQRWLRMQFCAAKLIGFIQEFGKPAGWQGFRTIQQAQPVIRFAHFFETDLQLMHKIIRRLSPLRFFIVCADGSSTTQQLIADAFANNRLRQRFNQLLYTYCKIEQPFTEIVLLHKSLF